MTPNVFSSAHIAQGINIDNNKDVCSGDKCAISEKKSETTAKDAHKWNIVWRNVVAFLYLYLAGFYGLYLTVFVCSWKTIAWIFYLLIIGTLGATAGAHRLWTHRTYKATLPLKILLVYFQTTCFQNNIYEWTRDHRMHHKYTDTDADPHNAKRGFFFSHVGWLMVRKHKEVKAKGETIWMKDLEQDPAVMFQRKYFYILMPLLCFILPACVPWYFWGERFFDAWYSAAIFRYMFNVNGTWLVNSACHIYGMRPYDKNIMPRENWFIGYFGLGEGWHNYHHTFPWDYKASEFNGYSANLTTGFIDLMAKIGWAYDLKEVPMELVEKRMAKTGDGSKSANGKEITYETHVWGWDDGQMDEEDLRSTKRLFVKKGE